jgi:hypothetical protein
MKRTSMCRTNTSMYNSITGVFFVLLHGLALSREMEKPVLLFEYETHFDAAVEGTCSSPTKLMKTVYSVEEKVILLVLVYIRLVRAHHKTTDCLISFCVTF